MPTAAPDRETVERLADEEDPLLHIFPGFERHWEPAPPVGALAYCGYVNRGLKHRWGPAPGTPARDDCVVCDELSASHRGS